MKTFYILNHKFLPTPYNHRFFVEKFARGFGYHDFDIKIISRVKQIKEPGFVMISNHYFFHKFGLNSLDKTPVMDLIRKFFSLLIKFDKTGLFKILCNKLQNHVIKRLAQQISEKNIVVLAWFWFERKEILELNRLKFILTGENHYSYPSFEFGKKWFDFYKKNKTSLPIEFAADIDPKSLNEINNKDILVGFAGNKNYKPDWYGEFLGNQNCMIYPTPPFISEEKRVSIYRRSRIILGLHADDNIKNHVVVERVFEALAYGCVCVTDHPDAAQATNDCAICIKDKEELLVIVEKIKNSDKSFEDIAKLGINFAKEKGTYFYQATKFIDLSENLFGKLF